jgi:hypothetical protein
MKIPLSDVVLWQRAFIFSSRNWTRYYLQRNYCTSNYAQLIVINMYMQLSTGWWVRCVLRNCIQPALG